MNSVDNRDLVVGRIVDLGENTIAGSERVVLNREYSIKPLPRGAITITIPDEFIPRLIVALDNWKSRQFWNPDDNPIDDLLQRVVAELVKTAKV